MSDEENAVPEAVEDAPAEKQTVEYWAGKKGMLPDVFPGGSVGLPPAARFAPGQSVPMSIGRASAAVAPRANPKYVGFHAAQVRNRWPIGYECTEAEFDEAVAKAYGPQSEVICR